MRAPDFAFVMQVASSGRTDAAPSSEPTPVASQGVVNECWTRATSESHDPTFISRAKAPIRSIPCLLLVACSGAEPADSDTVPVGDVPYGDAASGWGSVLTTDGSDFTCEWVEETCPTECAGNVAPVLGEPVMIVNGVPSSDVRIGDHVVLRVAYSDADCDIACGSASHGFVSPDGGFTL